MTTAATAVYKDMILANCQALYPDQAVQIVTVREFEQRKLLVVAHNGRIILEHAGTAGLEDPDFLALVARTEELLSYALAKMRGAEKAPAGVSPEQAVYADETKKAGEERIRLAAERRAFERERKALEAERLAIAAERTKIEEERMGYVEYTARSSTLSDGGM